MEYGIGAVVVLVCVIGGVWAAKKTGKVEAGVAGLSTLFLGPFGLGYVLWKCYGPGIGIAACVLGLGAPLAVFYFATPQEADMGRIERQIAFQLRQSGAVPQVQVDCPNDVEWSPGDTFDCTAFGGGQSAKLTVLMEDDFQYEWTP